MFYTIVEILSNCVVRVALRKKKGKIHKIIKLMLQSFINTLLTNIIILIIS